MRKWIIVALVLLGCVYFIKQKQAVEEAATSPRPNLIPRDVLLGTFDRVGARISPDGKYLAYRAPHEGVLKAPSTYVYSFRRGSSSLNFRYNSPVGFEQSC